MAIVGRPNVGKSTLFNRLVGKRRAIVDDTPGVTRDVREAPAQLGDLAFTLLDTAGWETTGGLAVWAASSPISRSASAAILSGVWITSRSNAQR